MAWGRAIGQHAVNYHRDTVAGPGSAFDYYAGGDVAETALVWRGDGAAHLGLVGQVTAEQYAAVFAPGGARDPAGEKWANTTRQGWELVVAPPKSVSVLFAEGGRHREAARAILEAESAATMGFLDEAMRRVGARRGHAGARQAATYGAVYMTTDHCTSRSGQPFLHRHHMIVNLVARESDGLTAAADLRVVTELTKAATMYGRVAAAYEAKQRGYHVGPDLDRDRNPTLWRIEEVPRELEELWSERSHEIEDEAERRCLDPKDWRARQAIARETRPRQAPRGAPRARARAGRPTGTARDLPVSRTAADRPSRPCPRWPRSDSTAPTWRGRRGPSVYGEHPAMLDVEVDRFLASAEAVALARADPIKQRLYSTLTTIEREEAIAACVERGVTRRTRPGPGGGASARASTPARARRSRRSRRSDRAVEILLGRAGSGKTTASAGGGGRVRGRRLAGPRDRHERPCRPGAGRSGGHAVEDLPVAPVGAGAPANRGSPPAPSSYSTRRA